MQESAPGFDQSFDQAPTTFGLIAMWYHGHITPAICFRLSPRHGATPSPAWASTRGPLPSFAGYARIRKAEAVMGARYTVVAQADDLRLASTIVEEDEHVRKGHI